MIAKVNVDFANFAKVRFFTLNYKKISELKPHFFALGRPRHTIPQCERWCTLGQKVCSDNCQRGKEICLSCGPICGVY